MCQLQLLLATSGQAGLRTHAAPPLPPWSHHCEPARRRKTVAARAVRHVYHLHVLSLLCRFGLLHLTSVRSMSRGGQGRDDETAESIGGHAGFNPASQTVRLPVVDSQPHTYSYHYNR